MTQVDLDNIYKDVDMRQFRHDMHLSREARLRGDIDESWRITAHYPHPPEVLKGIKAVEGAGFIRKYDINTSTADAKFGKGWLDE